MAAYHFICLNYEQGDEIILIGYSRGAFAVRCIINLVHEVGLLTRSGLPNIHSVIDGWWNNKTHDEINNEINPGSREDFMWHPRPHQFIKACGLWDTVNSVGRSGIFGPGRTLYFERGGVPPRVTNRTIDGVENIFHALSLHERRSLFQPVMTIVPKPWEGKKHEQCWFSGYHGDIGGGRPVDVLAHLPLAWMMAKLNKFIDFDKSAYLQQRELVTSLQGVVSRPAGKFLVGLLLRSIVLTNGRKNMASVHGDRSNDMAVAHISRNGL